MDNNFLFSDEKIITIEQIHNHQNDRVYAANLQSIDPNVKFVTRRQGPLSVMVWAGICSTGKTPLVFIEKGVKIHQEVYQSKILENVLLPWSQTHFGNQRWIFQQDSAPSHRAKLTVEWLRKNVPDFITPQEWPPYSPDLNPMDFSIWSILRSKACSTSHTSLETQKNH